MYSLATSVLNALKSNSREITTKIYIDDVEVNLDKIKDFSIESQLSSNNIPAIGSVFSNKLNINFIYDASLENIKGKTIKPHVGIKVNSEYLYIPLGVFYIEYITVSKTSIKIEAFDKLIYLSDITYSPNLPLPTNIASIINDLQTTYNLEFVSQIYDDEQIIEIGNNTSIRQLLSDIAELMGANCVVNREGKIEFRKYNNTSFNIDSNNYIDFMKLNEKEININGLVCGDISKFGQEDGYVLEIENKNIKDTATIERIYNKFLPIMYIPFELKVQGMPHIDVGDIIKLTDVNNNTYNLYITSHRLIFNGGLISEIKTNKPETPISTVGSTGENGVTQSIKKLFIQDIDAERIKTGTLLIKDGSSGAKIVVRDTNDEYDSITIDNRGIKVYKGNIEVADEEGRVILTAKGLELETFKNEINQSIDELSNQLTETNTNINNAIVNNSNAINERMTTEIGNVTANVSNSLNSINGDITSVQSTVNNILSLTTIDNNGITVGKSIIDSQVLINKSSITFKNNSITKAYINDNRLSISNIEASTSVIVGKHKIEKYNDTITVFKYIG